VLSAGLDTYFKVHQKKIKKYFKKKLVGKLVAHLQNTFELSTQMKSGCGE